MAKQPIPAGAWCAKCNTLYRDAPPVGFVAACSCFKGKKKAQWCLAPARIRLAPKPVVSPLFDPNAKREYVTVFCDASIDQRNKAAAWAIWVKGPHGTFTQAYRFKRAVASAAEAEKCAAANSLAIVRLLYKGHQHLTIVLQSDHLGIGISIKGVVSKNPHSRAVNALVHAEVQKVQELGWEVRYKHVKGHSGTGTPRSYVNDLLDKMAKAVMREVRKEKQQPTLPMQM